MSQNGKELFLWWDNEGSLEQRLQRATFAYQRRRGGVATVCELLPEAINGEKAVAGLELSINKRRFVTWRLKSS